MLWKVRILYMSEILTVLATSINQVEFAKEVIKSKFSSWTAILLIADPTTYNEIPNGRYLDIENSSDKIFKKVVYINKLINFENINEYKDYLNLANLLESKGIFIKEVRRLLIGLLSTKLYINFVNLFFNAKISIFSDGMMSFGPLRGDIYKFNLEKRIDSLFYEDLCYGIEPKYLPELKIKPQKINVNYCTINWHKSNKSILIALQSLSYSKILSKEEEYIFYSKYVSEIARIFSGYNIFVLPHPNNSSLLLNKITGANIHYLDNSLSGEEYILKYNINIVASAFSTLMFRAKSMGATCFAFGTDELLLKLEPYENSNRIPIILSRYCFSNFDDLSSMGDRCTFIKNMSEFKPNAELINKVLNALSILIKPSLSEYIDVGNIEILKSLSPYERGLLLSKGGYSRLQAFVNYKYNMVSYQNRQISESNSNIAKKENINSNNFYTEQICKIRKLEQSIESEKKKREQIKNSLSWKITKPIRLIGRIFR